MIGSTTDIGTLATDPGKIPATRTAPRPRSTLEPARSAARDPAVAEPQPASRELRGENREIRQDAQTDDIVRLTCRYLPSASVV